MSPMCEGTSSSLSTWCNFQLISQGICI
jgi:hypothetical protein